MPDEISFFTDDHGNEWATYKGNNYRVVSASDAAAKILEGQTLRDCYIESITRDILLEAEKNLKTGNLVEEAETVLLGRPRLTLRSPISCPFCFIGSLDLSGVTFRGGANFGATTFSGRADFWWATLSGEANFSAATFRGEANFWSATFSGKVNFSAATFSREAVFEGAAFSGGAVFSEATFSGPAGFSNATFSGPAGFKAATFSGPADFAGCAFLSCDLSRVRFEKICDLSGIVAGKLDLSNAVFTESVRFSPETDPERLAKFIERTRVHVSERKSRADSPREATTKLLHEAEAKADNEEVWKQREALALLKHEIETIPAFEQLLSEWQASGRAIHRVNFSGTLVQGDLRCDFEHLKPAKTRAFPMPRYEPVLAPHADGKWHEAEKQYAWLKEQYRKQGRYADEDEAHRWASECGRQQKPVRRDSRDLRTTCITLAAACLVLIALSFWRRECTDSIPLWLAALAAASLLYWERFGRWLVFKWAFGYGVGPWNIVCTIAVVLLAFSVLFGFAHASDMLRATDGRPPFESSFLMGPYFSVITFATVGYGDVRALGWAASAAMLEGLLGIVLNAALVVVIFRKVVR